MNQQSFKNKQMVAVDKVHQVQCKRSQGVLPYSAAQIYVNCAYAFYTHIRAILYAYMSYTVVMCRCEGYGFQRVYSRIEYRNQRVFGLE